MLYVPVFDYDYIIIYYDLDLSMVPEQSLVSEETEDIEMTAESLALALPDPALPDTENDMMAVGMEVALRDTNAEPTPSHSGKHAFCCE